MNRQQKEQVIELLKDNFNKSAASFVVNYQGLTVDKMQTLRNELRSQGGTLKVTKARLMKRAVDGMQDVEALTPYLEQQVGVVFASQEAPTVAKVLSDFAKDNEALQVVVGCLDAQLLDQASVARIASLPSKEVLLAQVCGTMKAPIAGLANVLNILVVRLLWTLKQVQEKKS